MKYLNKFFFPTTHKAIVPDDDADIYSVPVIVYCQADGNAVVLDKFGNELTYALVRGEMVPVQVTRMKETSTGTWYALWGD